MLLSEQPDSLRERLEGPSQFGVRARHRSLRLGADGPGPVLRSAQFARAAEKLSSQGIDGLIVYPVHQIGDAVEGEFEADVIGDVAVVVQQIDDIGQGLCKRETLSIGNLGRGIGDIGQLLGDRGNVFRRKVRNGLEEIDDFLAHFVLAFRAIHIAAVHLIGLDARIDTEDGQDALRILKEKLVRAAGLIALHDKAEAA